MAKREEKAHVKELKNEQEVKSLIILKCLKDENFKKQFLKDPKAAIEKEFQCELPKNAKIQVVEETENSKCFVVPYNANTEELSDEELKALAGGGFVDLLKGIRKQDVHDAVELASQAATFGSKMFSLFTKK